MSLISETEFVDASTALRLLSQRARALTGASGVAIALVHKESMICRASTGPSAPSLGTRLEITSGFSGECVRRGVLLRCDDSETDPRVDLTSCRRLGIRSILAIPISDGNRILGILEVFSRQPHAFAESHLLQLKELVQSAFPSTFRTKAIPESKLLIDAASPPKVLTRKVVAVLSDTSRTNPSSLAAQFWSDVFVPSQLPWKRFAQSLVLHVIMFAAIVTLAKFGATGPYAVAPALDASNILCYSSSDYFRDHEKNWRPARFKARGTRLRAQSVISVPKEQRTRTKIAVALPDIKLESNTRSMRMMAWSAVLPGIPASAIIRMQFIAPTAPINIVPPPPQTLSLGSVRLASAPTVTIIAPPPTVHGSLLHFGEASIIPIQVIAPTPHIEQGELNSSFRLVQPNLGEEPMSVIAPPPKLDGMFMMQAQQDGRLALISVQVVPPPPAFSTAKSHTWGPAYAAMLVVPPPPSLANVRMTYSNTLRTIPSIFAVTPVAQRARSRTGRAATSSLSNHPAAQAASSNEDVLTMREQLSIAPIAPALAMPSSSYFSSSEVFIAEERIGIRRRRYIKLVYDYLPYQKRLSEYGPNYPQVAQLHAKRDMSCDENLTSGVPSANFAQLSLSSLLQSQDSAQQETRLPCFRTTADDYRRALAQNHK